MCTSVVANFNKTLVGFNLDLLNMEYKVVAEADKVYIATKDAKEGWMPLFGANAKGDFVAMPTCWPFDERSNPKSAEDPNIILMDIDLLMGKRTLAEIKQIAETTSICSVPGFTFQSQLSDKEGNVLQITPGQGMRYLEKPKYSVMTNFSLFKGDAEQHPWMGMDRYKKAVEVLERYDEQFDVEDCFEVLKSVAQTVCPTVVSMVFDVEENTVYWCENREWNQIQKGKMTK